MRYALAALAIMMPAVAVAGLDVPPSPLTPVDLSPYQTSVATAAAIAAQSASDLAAVPALSPVQSVNQSTGVVSVPTFQRAVGQIAPNATTGVATATFPAGSFTSAPGCLPSVIFTGSGYVFSAPSVQAVSTAGVTFLVQASPNTGVTTWGPPPTGTTIRYICLFPQ